MCCSELITHTHTYIYSMCGRQTQTTHFPSNVWSFFSLSPPPPLFFKVSICGIPQGLCIVMVLLLLSSQSGPVWTGWLFLHPAHTHNRVYVNCHQKTVYSTCSLYVPTVCYYCTYSSSPLTQCCVTNIRLHPHCFAHAGNCLISSSRIQHYSTLKEGFRKMSQKQSAESPFNKLLENVMFCNCRESLLFTFWSYNSSGILFYSI